MRKLNKQINLDCAVGAVENISTGENPMRNSSKKMPWFLRFAPVALSLKGIAATAGIGALYGLLFAGLLFATLMPHLEAQSSGTPPRTTSTDHLQHGDQVRALWTNNPIWKKLPWKEWLAVFGLGVGSSIVGTAVWNSATKKWELPPGASSKGKVYARARIGIWKVDGEKTHWYSKSGKWAWQRQWGFNHNDPDDELNTDPDVAFPSSDNQKRDYHYYDYSCQRMMWDADNEIWKADPDGHRHRYGSGGSRFPGPDRINRLSNQGKPGWKYPDHPDYDKGKQGFFIWIGDHVKNYLSHEFYSSVYGKKDEDLAAEAKKAKKDKFHPYALVTVSDMTYTANGWKYERRAPSDKHRVTRKLSAVENEAKTLDDKEYIPLNTRHEETEYFYNNSIVYWSARIKWRSANVQAGNSDLIIEDQTIPVKYEAPEQTISHYNW